MLHILGLWCSEYELYHNSEKLYKSGSAPHQIHLMVMILDVIELNMDNRNFCSTCSSENNTSPRVVRVQHIIPEEQNNHLQPIRYTPHIKSIKE